MISQLTVFMENERGRLASACRAIADAGINMYALFVADTADFGVARIFCDTPQAAADTLMEAGYRAAVTPVLGVRVPDEPGGLASLLEFLDGAEANIEYGYCFAASDGTAVDVLKIDGAADIEQQLVQAGFRLVKPEEIYEPDC